MCGALSERGHTEEELKFASSLINAVCQGFPKERIAMHVCRGNWTPDENMALAGDYSPLLPLFNQLEVGRLILEFCTPRAGDLHVLKNLRKDIMLGLGVLNPKTTEVESIESILKQVRTCIELIGINRITLNPDCGFATFADNPVNSAEIATAKLASAVKAAAILRTEYGL
jgi:5-methyltetrahydropteroyltriglutamate--homocysteine methyltransferase